ncbi:palmitoyltransferase ZDHHC23 isoform X2 [Condylostylus longicornis]|uniref:palmitoyltransferase ZDHHC23 isoform X2 n=1 Tax=Condylostylus longicornis TaxID=2530218 RepID=UPI00244DAEBC|nr:palmitoyltransferase ZDHHC23 isoform X2 [Condylostylus longicornis]
MESLRSGRDFHTEIDLEKESEDGDTLCCCEYLDRNHEKNHILLCCCNCRDFDETIERLICCRPIERRHSIGMLLTFQDRLRIPWCGGAKQISLDCVAPMILIPILLCIASIHYVAAVVIGIITLGFLSNFYYQFRSSAYRTKFFFMWIIWSGIYMKFIFQIKVPLLEILPAENYVFIILIGITIFCFYKTRKNANKNMITQGLSSEDDLEDIAEEQTSVLIDNEDEDDSGHTPEICRNCRKYVPPRAYHCILCKACILRGDHHSLWLDCCIGVANHRTYVVGLIFSIMSLIFGAYLTLTSICYGYLIKTIYGVHILFPDDCTYVFDRFETSLPFVVAIYALIIAFFIILAIGIQIYLISNGITMSEWRKGQKSNQKTLLKNVKSFIYWLH